MYTDDELKQRILDLDSEAIDYLYQKYSNRVYSAAMSVLKSRELAEDFTQDFFIKFIYGNRGIKRFDAERGTLSAYINVRLRSERIDRLRQIQKKDEMEVDLSVPAFDRSDDPESSDSSKTDHISEFSEPENTSLIVEHRECREILSAAIKNISPECQRVIQLRYFLGLTYAEIAKKLNVKEKTVSSRLCKCMKKFGKILRNEFSRIGYDPF